MRVGETFRDSLSRRWYIGNERWSGRKYCHSLRRHPSVNHLIVEYKTPYEDKQCRFRIMCKNT